MLLELIIAPRTSRISSIVPVPVFSIRSYVFCADEVAAGNSESILPLPTAHCDHVAPVHDLNQNLVSANGELPIAAANM